jgi:regulator of sigma E protease
MLLTIAAFVFVLGVLVFVHELGHFLMARRIGVRVITFSLGFGPKVFAFRRGDTEYCVSAIPLGGYVKMAGETPDDPGTGQPDEFLSKTKWQRFQVLIMGPVMNILLAVVLMWVVLTQAASVPVVNQVLAGEAAERGGLRAGDILLAVNGQSITRVSQVTEVVARYPEQKIVVTVQRGTVRQDLEVTPGRRGQRGYVGIEFKTVRLGPVTAATMSLQQNYEASKLILQTLAGLFTGDTSPRQLMGPVAIAQESGKSAKLGWVALLGLMSMISLNLGILNLLPIPVLDGGHIFILALEGLARRAFSIRVKESLLLAGFAVLMALMVTVIYNDLTRIASVRKFMFWT